VAQENFRIEHPAPADQESGSDQPGKQQGYATPQLYFTLYEGALLINNNLESPSEFISRMTEIMQKATQGKITSVKGPSKAPSKAGQAGRRTSLPLKRDRNDILRFRYGCAHQDSFACPVARQALGMAIRDRSDYLEINRTIFAKE